MDNLLFSVHDGWAVSGWAADFDQIGKALRIEILHEGQILVTGSANKYRQDLFDEGIGDGLHGFLFPLSFDLLKQAESLELSMRLAGQDIAIGDAVVFQVKPAVGWLNKLEFALAPATSSAARRPIIGCLDKIEGIVISGWAYNPSVPSIPVSIDMLMDEQLAGRVIADQYRSDLTEYGTRNHGFQWIVPEVYADGKSRRVSARITNQAEFLSGELFPVVLVPSQLSVETRRQLFLRCEALHHAQSLEFSLFEQGRYLNHTETITAGDLPFKRFALPAELALAETPMAVTPKSGTGSQ